MKKTIFLSTVFIFFVFWGTVNAKTIQYNVTGTSDAYTESGDYFVNAVTTTGSVYVSDEDCYTNPMGTAFDAYMHVYKILSWEIDFILNINGEVKGSATFYGTTGAIALTQADDLIVDFYAANASQPFYLCYEEYSMPPHTYTWWNNPSFDLSQLAIEGWFAFAEDGYNTNHLFNGYNNYANAKLELVDPVPEPATMLLFGSGLIGLACFRKRFFKK
jgi:hypothetical protein